MERFLKSRYKIGKQIGENAYSITYKGNTLSQEHPVIIKIYKRSTLNSPLIKVMKNKVRKLSQLHHPSVARLLDGDYGWQGFYYVREYINGESLKDIFTKHPQLEEEDAVRIAVNICEGLSAVHDFGLVHGALNPNNVFIASDGSVKLTDFIIEGEIKESLPEKIAFIKSSAEYLSPEELQGEKANRSSDIYSVGLLLFQMTTGRLPYQGNAGSLDLVLQKLKNHITPPSFFNPKISKSIEEIILKSMALDPIMRFKNIGLLKQSLEAKALIEPSQSLSLPPIFYEDNDSSIPAAKEAFIKSDNMMGSIEKQTNYQVGNWIVRLLIITTLVGIIYAIISIIFK
jgi:eukaryotic-like serine/threonine-protein kinase